LNSLSYALGGKYELFREVEGGIERERLMAYYALTEGQYEKVMGFLKDSGRWENEKGWLWLSFKSSRIQYFHTALGDH
jgi:hypothetical protein